MLASMLAGRRRVVLGAIVLAGIAAVAAVLVTRGGAGSTAARPAQIAVPVQVAAAKAGPIRSVLTYSGAIQASQQVNVSPRASGQITSIKVGVGSTVRAGDALATLDPGTLAAQVQQASAGLQSAQARLALQVAGARPEDIAAAQAQFNAAQAKYDQLLKPSASDLATVESGVVAAEVALRNTESAVTNTRGALLGQIFLACGTTTSFGVPCNNVVVPLSASAVDSIAASLTTAVGSVSAEGGTRNTAVLSANAAHTTAIANVSGAQEALNLARAKREALRNPSHADTTAQHSLVEVARANLATKQNLYTDADIQTARAAVSQAQATLAIAQANLDQTVVAAPFDGVIGQKLLDVGSTASPLTPIFTLVGKAVELHLSVDEARVGQIRPDQNAELTVPAYPDKIFKAKVATVAPTGDARAHTFDVKVFADDPGAQLKPGMFAQVGVIVAQKPNTILVPNAAITQQARGSVLFVAANGKASQRVVKVGVTDAANSEILEGVAAGDQIVIVGQNVLRDGQAVQIPTPSAGGSGGSGPGGSGGGAGGAGGAGAPAGSGASGATGGSGPRGAGATGGGGARPGATP